MIPPATVLALRVAVCDRADMGSPPRYRSIRYSCLSATSRVPCSFSKPETRQKTFYAADEASDMDVDVLPGRSALTHSGSPPVGWVATVDGGSSRDTAWARSRERLSTVVPSGRLQSGSSVVAAPAIRAGTAERPVWAASPGESMPVPSPQFDDGGHETCRYPALIEYGARSSTVFAHRLRRTLALSR